MKKDFNDCLGLIQNEKIRNLVTKALAAAPVEFWKDPSSASGKHHPPENQVEGGIVIHSRKAVFVALELFVWFNIKDQLSRDKVVAACILHDIAKYGVPWRKWVDKRHGPIAADWLKRFIPYCESSGENRQIFPDEDLNDVVELVRNHMGRWNRPVPTPALAIGKEVSKKDILSLIVQIADFWSSQKWCPFVADKFGEK